MLKALELIGFKSFADRTRFEFPRGVSVIVGPNGSGKSNIVDAVRWVLGSQSAKSLRGQEMVDVIFNGSSTRGPMGTAEVTLTLDNSSGALPIDKAEVHVTRRVYRSGEGEYLIDRQPCRLRDVRDLLAGTGITTEGYSIIEQGKVDLLLQSSPRDRRLIFEEAAGISQFKIKKAAAARRLERVEQNLLRLSDIVDEVESRLRSVRMQAGKARRYRDCTTRLQQLRTEVGLVDWRSLTKQIATRDEQLAELKRQMEARAATLAELEAEEQALGDRQQAAGDRRREIESQAAATREKIAALEAVLASQAGRRGDLEQDVARAGRQVVALATRAGNASDQLREAAASLASAEAELAAADREFRLQLEQADELQRDAEAARTAIDTCRAEHVEAVNKIAILDHQQIRLESRLQAVGEVQRQHERQLAEIQREREQQAERLAEHRRQESLAEGQASATLAELRQADDRLAAAEHEVARVDRQLRQLESRLGRTRERITILTELDERFEGLSSGVHDVLLAASREPEGPFGDVCGVVADLFQVDVDSAPLVDAALGERSAYLVLASAGRLLEWLSSQPGETPGRVGFARLDARVPGDRSDEVDLSSEPGVMGRADRFVETADRFAPLVRRLLGSTWFVDHLSTALRLSQTTGRGLDFVTSDGQLLKADGTLVIGPRQSSAGLLSRRSELLACRQLLADLERQLLQLQSLDTRLDAQRSECQRQRDEVARSSSVLTTRLAEHRHQTAVANSQLEQLVRLVTRTAAELQQTREQSAAVERELQQTQQAKQAAEQDSVDAQRQQQAAAHRLQQCEGQISMLQAATTEKRIAAAKCEERVEMLRGHLDQAERDQQERAAELADAQQRLATREAQLKELDQSTLASQQTLAEHFLCRQRHADELAQQVALEQQLRSDKEQLHARLRQERSQSATLQSQQHKLDVAANKLRHERQTLAERMQDDYGIDLAAEAGSGEQGVGSGDSLPAPGSGNSAADRDAVEQEIADLRNQINQIGAVNLDALEELEELEARFGGMSQQYRDLVDAKASLERVVQRINVDSRQLFLATLESVRGHFRELFRRLFGGGEADILVDDAQDVLECGIDVVACPPGKEACNISLLSGGEKTLTCVALLLAVFRSKPSPFCVLDEVDAALDEANIGRFVQVLREFLSSTQFVVVTHSKKTMAGADTLYGVTMEESGVSKQVSVRFEDVSEDGQMLLSGPRGDPQAPATAEPPAERRAA